MSRTALVADGALNSSSLEDNIAGIDELKDLAPFQLQRIIQSMTKLRIETNPEEADDDASRPLSARASIRRCTVKYANERVVSNQRGCLHS